MSKLDKHLVAGPWIGEFGWELFAWQAYIRAMSRLYEKTTIICRSSSVHLYEDFSNDFIDCSPTDGQADSFFMNGVDLNLLCNKVLRENRQLLGPKTVFVPPRRVGFPPQTSYLEAISFGQHSVKPEYIKYGRKNKRQYDYVFHIRSRELRKQDNWSIENWQNLRKLLGDDKRIACIGTKRSSGIIGDVDDLRDQPLKEVCDVLYNSSCAFGPSSGPMHLASLCGTPHVVWSRPENKNRYEITWNPLSTKVLFMGDHSWHPSSEYVYENYKKWSE
tara:strand:+ start:15699 stop:16523 length:825 start_codon:yes stop_codon:yes gene_type:complete